MQLSNDDLLRTNPNDNLVSRLLVTVYYPFELSLQLTAHVLVSEEPFKTQSLCVFLFPLCWRY